MKLKHLSSGIIITASTLILTPTISAANEVEATYKQPIKTLSIQQENTTLPYILTTGDANGGNGSPGGNGGNGNNSSGGKGGNGGNNGSGKA
ncbi:hypothetical protein KKJ17_07700 [Xenorhabdus bovienii]|uniref:hypothetical protein n=1 Tax=Xenorhabdus bovienii TaxID=40576 RepID=UPI0023B336DC|nr:hypothetical protein [Xenorhabdus bovienii]MDE9494417.1 hypothetical protein [Xenorhabdus bovienii]MDE9502856.1 hypothetical protein [Xenorhabdus bovienii]MDE9517631.1 hypothetical protein [Xenorhabdus bovienii]MDE9527983.1 hypothetical protein [Xenorhabdus bovienii]MDE9569779.1 hypothetical protein [Xenorhabdus bovienii]